MKILLGLAALVVSTFSTFTSELVDKYSIEVLQDGK